MTSTATPPNTQAPNSSAATSAAAAPSYASAAGASRKPASTPATTGANPSPVVVGGSAAHHAKQSGPSPVNGRQSITPAVPAAPAVAAHGNNIMNGAGNHSRKSSVTISASGPNSYAANGGPVGGGSKSNIQFGFKDSPSLAHASPQITSAPIPIPGGNQQRVPSPAHSPSPIPQPSATGGRPPSSMAQQNAQMTFGSLGSDGDRHMRQASMPQNPAALGSQSHIRRESAVSQHSDVSGGPGPAANRPNFQPHQHQHQQAGRGRGGPPFNPQHPPFNPNPGFPPNYNSGPGRGRGGMPPSFHPAARPPMGYPNSPQPNRSPALAHSQPGTPNMPHAQMHAMPNAAPYHYPAPGMPPHQVHPPPFLDESFSSFSRVGGVGKKKSGRQMEKYSNRLHHSEFSRDLGFAHNNNSNNRFRGGRQSRRGDSRNGSARWMSDHGDNLRGPHPSGLGQPPLRETQPLFPLAPSRQNMPAHLPLTPIDLSPASGNFERVLTARKQFAYPASGGQFDPMNRQTPYYMPQPYMPQGPGGSPAANYAQTFVPPPYHTPAPQSMSRTSSHSERPPSSTGQPNHPVIVSGSQGPNAQPGKTGPQSSVNIPKKKSNAISIKNPNSGETLDFSGIKAPASPSPSIQQAKTPPVIASTPPPQKANTPAHVRNESHSTPKTAKEIQEELRAKIKLATSGEDKSKLGDTAKAQASEQTEKKSAEAKPQPAAQEQPAAAEVPSKEPEVAAPAKDVKAEEPKPKESAAAAPADEEDEVERMIREMEEEDARREKEAAEYETKRKAAAEEKKKLDAEKKKLSPEEEDRKLRDAEREAERLEEEKEKKRAAAESSGEVTSIADALSGKPTGAASSKEESEVSKVGDVADKLSSLSLGGDSKAAKPSPVEKQRKPPALNLAPISTKPVEPPQPSAALQSLKSARFLSVMDQSLYPAGISSPNPALNAAVAKKGKTFKYDAQFLLQFQKVFTEQPSMEFHQQVKTLIGDNDGSRSASTPRPGSSRQPSRVGSFAAGPQQNMGSFNARGTTSAERFARSNAGIGGSMPPPMGNFGRTGSFPVGNPMSRNPSTSNAAPNSPRTGSRRGNSRRNDGGAKEAQAAKTMPLTQGMDLKPITVSATGWKPNSLTGKPGASAATGGHMDPEMVQRKVKAALNKMTPEKFEKIADQIFDIAAQSKNETDGRTLRQVIQLTFEKATDEAHWASMYAKFCKKMLDTMSPDIRDENLKDKNGDVICGGALFRKYLLNRCQEEFERGWKMDLPDKPEEEETGKEKTGEAAMLSDEYYIAAAAKRRGLGLVQFIGELYKLGMLTERIMHACVHKLVDYDTTPEEAEIESLCKLLRTIGGNLDASPKAKAMMDAYFERIQSIVNRPDLPSRLKYMLMDVIDLRRKGWLTKEDNKGPKTLDEVRVEAEAAAAAKAQEASRGSQRGPPGGRLPMGRGDARSFSNYNQQTSNHVPMDDLRRLKGSTSRTTSGISLGPQSMFSSRSNSGRRLGPGGSLGRAGEDSNASSRTGTPPTTNTNAFSALANLDTEHPASPPSTAASPALSKAVPDSSAAGESK